MDEISKEIKKVSK